MFDIAKEFVHLPRMKRFIYEKFPPLGSYRMRIVKWYRRCAIRCVKARFNRVRSLSRDRLWIPIGATFSLRLTNPVRGRAVKSARKARRYLEKRAALRSRRGGGEGEARGIKEILVGSASESARGGEWIFEGDSGVSDLRATARRSRAPLSGPRVFSGKENDKNIYVPRKLHGGGGPKPIARYHRNALHILIAPPGVR